MNKSSDKTFTTRIIVLIILLHSDILVAQDTHYWTNQYGTKSVLMGGAVVGGIKNNTSLFYNPGALGFIDTSSLSINANAYSSTNITLKNALGQQKDFKSANIAAVPLLVGGMFRSGKENKWKIAYGIVTNVDFHFNANARVDQEHQIVDESESPGKEDFIAQAGINSRLKEITAGVGVARKISENWSVGISGFVIVRNQEFFRYQYARMYLNDNTGTLVATSFARNLKFYNVRFAPKIGIAYEKNNLSAGLTVSTPALNLFGKGSIGIDIIGNNIDTDTGRINFLGNDSQEKLKTKYKSPFSVSAGVNYDLQKSSLGISLQYFGGIGVYDVMRAAPSAFVRPASLNQDLTSDQYLRLKSGARSVFNVAVGYEYRFSETLSMLASFRTDMSYFDQDVKESIGIKSEITTWNIFHFNTGVIISRGRSQLSIGLLTSFGSDKNRSQEGNLDNPSEENYLQGSTTIVGANYFSAGILLGYTLSFKKF
ncbi:hypothetical protein [Pollutibacter soli]|uniref:hypothetical protein n=1 Tax=Pollutibacter soli TaxID=3034157 RepID=UPI003013BCDC